ncbi:conserved hypothetical protein [Leishmania infantum JPCM5]|uniref:Uncharacterized protein n=2 Tax=Leishmania infantum TaxID=5671 RepID=A4HVL1_LEIIN|nr:conserved hypothetical protein [Leishmania infantum JPCM5]CAC9465825.1 hypothetical_protein_-_conserved [Leishmania infantum]CAM66478.1 conserved hypothetical protein [Leishmania infantum JPCM5]SUZ40132.1 hypothetical_protein_-_conserved [Leishmania infantum]|eukprot:XP_001464102.1 conserved hypothetical protein [Leishmania infantum JPCM5]
MSRTFVEDNGCERPSSAGQRVYVNNMNTLQATTSLPERTPYSLFERNTEAPGSSTANYVGSRLAPISSPRSGRGPDGAAGELQQSRPAQRAFAGSGSAVEQRRGAEPLTANGEAVHANLQDVYSRIMRRLQRQMNYAEVSRASLAEQYGVDLQMAYEEDQQELKAADTAPQRTTKHRCRTSPSRPPASTSSSPIHPVPCESEANTVSRPSPRLFTGCHVSTNTTKVPEYDSPGPPGETPISARAGGRSSSRLIQFKVDVSSRTSGAVGGIAAPAAMDMSDASGAAAPAAEESRLERDIAAQPCPLPLRLVIQHVLDTLQKKMSLAEGGSLKDCIVFSFESRALLDRLLKEIPLYSQYSVSQDTAAVAGAAQQDMALVYQKLRQKPVLLPRAGYVEDPVTGAIHGQILGGGAVQSESVRASAVAAPTAAVSLPAIVNASRSFNPGGAAPLGALTVGTGAMSGGVQLPSGYGKSSRLNDATLQSGAAAGYGDRQHQHQLLRDHMKGGSGAGGGSSASISDAVSAQNSVTAMMESAVASVAPPPVFEAAHRATRLVSVGTVTEENNLTTVPKADYAALQQRMEALEVQLADAQMHRSALADQLCEELQYTEKKKRVLQYLRETLVRECTMLRSQLRLASGRVQLLQQQQHSPPQPLRGVMVSSGANDAHSEGPNASVFGATTRMYKQLGASTVSPMTLSLSADVHGQQHRRYSQRPLTLRMSFSESIGSVYGGTSGCGRGRLATMQRHTSGGCTSLGASLSAAPPGVSVSATGISSFTVVGSCVATGVTADGQQPNDLEAVQSLLDLVLLAVEEDAVLPSHTLQMVRSGHADVEAVKNAFSKDEKRQLDELRNKYDERQYAVKKSMIMRTAEHNYLIAEQKHEVQRLQALTDTTRVRAILQQHVSDLRTELQQMRMYITEQIHFFKTVIQNTAQSLLRRSVLADKTLSENLILTNVVSASREMVESAGALFMPMLTKEYCCGYHPWPLKLRNTTDPLAHIIHLRYGAGEVIRLRDSLNVFAQLYGALHRYILRQIVLPDSTRPSAGKPLQHLCAALALNPMSHTEVVFAVRHAYDTEMQLCKRLARYNLRLMWNAYLQRVYTNRSVAALAEACLNPRLAALPVAGRINVLAKERAALLQERVKVQRERAENAKSTYRLWQEKEIDIMEGYPTPQTQRNRLALLTGDAAGGSNAMGVDVGGNALGGAMQGHSSMATMGHFSRTLGRTTTDRSEGAGAVAM